MEFHYYYIIQDIIGVLMAFIGIRMFTLTMRIMISRKKSKKSILLSVSYILITIAGLNLLFNSFGLKHWGISIMITLLSVVIIKITLGLTKKL